MLKSLNIVLLLATLTVFQVSGEVLVNITTGQIRGLQDVTNHANLTYYAYLQVPYAKPPLGNLRFASPQKADKWDGVLDCTVNNKICRQFNEYDIETEDCLHVNVITPVAPGKNASLPVMFFIHGGGFVGGWSVYQPGIAQFLIEQEVVVVTVSYRLGAYGFLTTNDNTILGNYGLKDQNLALQWVHENIHSFGGSPNKVTIFGQSAGAASVTYHLLSGRSTGLFRGAIALSGSLLCPWSYQRDAKKIAYNLASLIDSNFTSDRTSEELLEFLRTVDADLIDSASNRVTHNGEEMVQGFQFTPTMEPADAEEAFYTDFQFRNLALGKINPVPLLAGICSEEQVDRVGNLEAFKKTVAWYEEDLNRLVNDNFHLEDSEAKKQVGAELRKIYTNKTFSEDLAAAVRYFSDVSFSNSVITHARIHAYYYPAYFFEFSYHGELGNNNAYIEGAERVTHGEEQNYLWTPSVENVSEADLLTVRRYTKMLTDFAKTLNPTPQPSDLLQNVKLPKIGNLDFHYLNLNDTIEIKSGYPKGDDLRDKWQQVYLDYAIPPLDTQ